MSNKKIQAYEKELRNFNKFNKTELKFIKKELYETYFEIALENKEFKKFIDNQYKKELFIFDSMFGKEDQRNDEEYALDIFIFNFKTPINLRNKILKYMKFNKIETLPYDKVDLILYCDGKVYLNGEINTPYKTIIELRDLKLDRFPCKLTLIPPKDIESFKLIHTDLKKHFFTVIKPFKMKREEVNEYIKLLDKEVKIELSLEESERKNELYEMERKEKCSKIEYIYKAEDNNPIIIDKMLKLSELEKLLNGLRFSIESIVRENLSTTEILKRSNTYRNQKKIDGICDFFDTINQFSKMDISNKIRTIRAEYEENKEFNQNEMDEVIDSISKFTIELEKLFFLEMGDFFENKKYKF